MSRLLSLLPVRVEESLDTIESFFQIFYPRQEHDAEMVGFRPVETGSLHHQHFFLPQQIQGKLLVVVRCSNRSVSIFGKR